VVVEPGDRDGMAAALRRLYETPSCRARLAQNARAAGLVYDRPRAVEAYRNVLEEVVQ
jgi:hypothetical protein